MHCTARLDSSRHPSSSSDRDRGRARVRHVGSRSCALAILVIAAVTPHAFAAQTPMVDLGSASTYAVLSGASVGNTVSAAGAPHTTVRGDLGVLAAALPTGFPPGVVTGTIQVGNSAAGLAHADIVTAYGEIAQRPDGAPLASALAGAIIGPGLYTVTGAASNTGTLTLDGGGDPNAVFVLQVGGALAMAAGSHVVLIGGARASRVFWQVNGAGSVGANAGFAGTLLAMDAVAVGNGTVVNGRAFARNGALTLDANEFYSSPPAVTISGGAGAITPDTTPTISGTTDVDEPSPVAVTIDGQPIAATRIGSDWSATPSMLANGTYLVVASVVDGAGNTGSASQQLTVDTVLPVATIDGDAQTTTIDATPTLSGTSDVPPGTIVHVGVDLRDMTALVQDDGTWNVTPVALADGAHTITASVTDPAGNDGAASQVLTVDTVAPKVTISGGAAASTSDSTPTVVGTSDTSPGTTVTVSIGTQVMTAYVQSGGSWIATPTTIGTGTWTIFAAAGDLAGNVGSTRQDLTIEPPRATTLVALRSACRTTAAGTSIRLTGTLRTAAGPVGRRVRIRIWQVVGSRMVLRRTTTVTTTGMGTFTLSHRINHRGAGIWRARASFVGTATTRPASSRIAAWVATPPAR